MSEQKAQTVAELREALQQALVDAAYYKGRAESLEGLMAQRNAAPAPGAAGLPPELLTALLAAKMKDKGNADQ